MGTERKNVSGVSSNVPCDGWMECHRIPITRRSLLRDGLLGVTGLWLANPLQVPAMARSEAAKARSVIQIWQWGGPAHIDTFDPKPGLGNEYNGPFTNTQATGIPGVALGEHLPLLAAMTDKYALLRSMTHGQNGHETAAYMVQTGHPAGGELVYPHVGAVVSRFLGQEGNYEGLIPPYIVLTQPQGRFSESGFLGSRYKPFATGGDPNRPRFEVEGVVAPGISDARQQSRRDLLGRLNTLAHALEGDPRLEALPPMRKRSLRSDPGRRGQSIRPGPGTGCAAGPIRPQHVRPVLFDRAPPGGSRGPVHHDQLWWMGHA